MFLDEQLLQTCIDYNGTSPGEVNNLNKTLCGQCESYYKSKIKSDTTDREVKAILDRTFNLWDSFIRMALKHDDAVVVILGELFQKHTFKYQLLNDEQIKNYYIKL